MRSLAFLLLAASVALAAGCARPEAAPDLAATASWQPLAYGNPVLTGFSEVRFASAQVGWVIGGLDLSQNRYNPQLLTTRDGGATWARQSLSPLTLNGFQSIAPVSEQLVFALGVDPVAAAPGTPANPAESRAVYKSTNGGSTWQQLPGNGFLGSFHLHFFDDQKGLSFKNQRIQQTRDGGVSWHTALDAGTDWSLAQFPGEAVGYAAGGYVSTGIAGGTISRGNVAKSIDQGTTWQVLPWPYQAISSLSFISATTGFAATVPDHHLYKTQDGGTTWALVNSQLPAASNGRFFNELDGFMAEGSVIAHTHDGGLSWQQEYQVTPLTAYSAAINSMYFAAPEVGFAVTADGQVIKGTR